MKKLVFIVTVLALALGGSYAFPSLLFAQKGRHKVTIKPVPPKSIRPIICGDKRVGEKEECDDGNTRNGDGCSAECRNEKKCPAGAIFIEGKCVPRIPPPPALPRCGDGVVDTGEVCDDGNTTGGDGCNAACSMTCEPPPLLERCPFWTGKIPTVHSDLSDMDVDRDDNILVVGMINGSEDPFIVSPLGEGNNALILKYDRCGSLWWSRVINTVYDWSAAIRADTDRNVYVILSGDSVAGSSLRKYDECGSEIWTSDRLRSYGYTLTVDDSFGDIYVAGLGAVGYIGKYSATTGLSSGSPWPIDIDVPAPENVGFPRGGYPSSILTDAGSNIFIAGGLLRNLDFNAWVTSYSPEGVRREFGSGGVILYDGEEDDFATDIAIDADRNIYFLHETSNLGLGDNDCRIEKVDSTGLSVGSPFPLIMEPCAGYSGFSLDLEGNIYWVGRVIESPWTFLLSVRKYSSSGILLWEDQISDSYLPNKAHITVGTDGSVYVALIRYGAGWSEIFWTRKYTPCGESDDGPPDVQNDPACSSP